jgi:hypothetical protein
VDELDKSSQCIASGNVARECPPEAELVRPQLQLSKAHSGSATKRPSSDYGNAETDNHADGKGAMEAVVRHKLPPPPRSSASSTFRFQADRCHLTHTGAK